MENAVEICNAAHAGRLERLSRRIREGAVVPRVLRKWVGIQRDFPLMTTFHVTALWKSEEGKPLTVAQETFLSLIDGKICREPDSVYFYFKMKAVLQLDLSPFEVALSESLDAHAADALVCYGQTMMRFGYPLTPYFSRLLSNVTNRMPLRHAKNDALTFARSVTPAYLAAVATP